MSEPFLPLQQLIIKPVPKLQSQVTKCFQEIIVEEGEVRGEPVVSMKIPMKDKRKFSTIDRSTVYKRMRDNNVFNVKNVKETVTEKEYEKPIGEPEIVTKKVEKRLVLADPSETEPVEDVEEQEQEEPVIEIESEELTDLDEILNAKEKKVEEEEQGEVIEIVDKPKKKRTSRKNLAQKVEDDLININLTTSLIRDKPVFDRLPKQKQKVLVKAPTYYMNNRKISIQKLNELFQPYRKEIVEDEAVSCERNDDSGFSLLTHQKIVRDYLNLYTPYRGLLLYHSLGSGKTCSSIAIAEGMKTDKPIYILTPASLKMNFFSELKSCGDELYKKNQYWEFVSTEGKPEYIPVLAKALSLSTEYIRNLNGAWLVNIEKPANFTEKTAAEQKDIDNQLNEMIRSKYIDINYNGLNEKIMNNLTNNGSKNPFDNAVILVDEAHNFVSRIVNKVKKPKSIAYRLYDYLMSATNARVVFMSGTPIINYPNEIGVLYNILRGYIKTWTMTVNVKTSEKINTDTILDLFDKENFRTYDYVEYSGNKLTITRNPFGFINAKKRGVVKGTQRNKDKVVIRKTKKNMSELIGGADAFDKYDGVRLDEMGNISDTDFQNILINILTKHGLEVPKGSMVLNKYKALPDVSDEFLKMFVNTEQGSVQNMDVFQRRILGLTSYFRSAQEKLLPRLIKTEQGDVFHVIKSEMGTYQFGIYEKIRKVEAEQEKRNKQNQRKDQGDDDLFKISSTYRIFSRAACNFVFPAEIKRPLPSGDDNEEIDEDKFDGTPKNVIQNSDQADEEDLEDEKNNESENVNYQKRIEAALEELKFNEQAPREKEFLLKENLEMYSPKFVQLLDNIQSQENQGLHLLYSQFRTIEGIGILKLILQANGFAEFRIQKVNDTWEMIDDARSVGKPKFVLYTGTETAEEKEIIRNIYNSNWGFVPPNIANRLQEQYKNNFFGEVIKVFMITSSGAEGINLKNTRFVHIVEPYWHMVRIEQVIGRARRICSHQDLPEDLRTVKVFLYISTLSEEQKTSKQNIELRIRDLSKLDRKTPVTTDETLFEIASLKDRINRQILKAVKESAVDCSLYSSKNKDESLVCYGYGKIESNQFGSYPSFEQDRGQKMDLNLRAVAWEAKKITFNNKDYAWNQRTNEIYDYNTYLQSKETGEELVLIGNLEKTENGYVIRFLGK